VNSTAKKAELFKSQYFCMMPWVHMHSWPDGKTFPCCMGDQRHSIGDLKTQTIAEIWNDKPIKELRKRMLSNQPSPQCRKCYEIEANSLKTRRLSSLEDYQHHFDIVVETKEDGTVEKINLAYFDFRFSNLCNLKCRTCGPEFSTSWYDEYIKLNSTYKSPKLIEVNLWSQIEPLLLNVEEICFAGGEPLINETHYRILDYWIEKKHNKVKIQYTTNFTRMDFKQKSIFDYWNQFESVEVAASLDASHERGEYLRKGLKWADIIENRKKMKKQSPHVRFKVTPTISLYNVAHLTDFHKEWVEMNLIKPWNFRLNLLLDPMPMRIQVLPKKLKDKIAEKYTKHIQWLSQFPAEKIKKVKTEYQGVIDFMFESDRTDLISNFLETTNSIDKIRGENVFEVFPELSGLI
jgi:radical SAM protein with 4Fe4S-binding SPASM domain